MTPAEKLYYYTPPADGRTPAAPGVSCFCAGCAARVAAVRWRFVPFSAAMAAMWHPAELHDACDACGVSGVRAVANVAPAAVPETGV